MSHVVEFSDVNFHYDPGKKILDNVSFVIHEHQSVSIMGLSGCGKSTVLSLMIGLLKPLSGQIKMLGQDLSSLSTKRLSSLYREIGVGFQQGGLLGRHSVQDNLRFAMEKVRGWDKNEQDLRVDRFLHQMNLWHARDLYPHQLSGGMKRRLSIARALCTDPKTMFLDNPTAGLDPISSRQLIKVFDSVKNMNKVLSVVCFTSHVDVGMKMAAQSLILHNGQIIADKPWKDILAGPECFAKELLSRKAVRSSTDWLDLPISDSVGDG